MKGANMKPTLTPVHEIVRERYAQAARSTASCCSPASNLYPADLITELPSDISDFSLGCGNPIEVANIKPGETVLDLGSGGGLDCFLAARKVGSAGKVIGVDMTPEMLERSRSNAARLGITNVEFREGYLEALPVEQFSVDVVISNCVINLSPDKPQVFREIFRVLKPGGRIAVSDIVTNGLLPESIRSDMDAWGACVAGAMDIKDYSLGLLEAGFDEVKILPKTGTNDLMQILPVGQPFSAIITAHKSQ
jgi:SAM-dependent methyltransferase